ncbi:cellulase family glycosylhydrolase [Salipaludibacillus agaradhaerens]|uniref:Putative cellulase n=1 Tax=Salipaludibacillus agaradhaerens TaxID=76935 RepID=Q6A3Q5_SALAG|nr:cellulase family glycosylhydrolase [Salipaludibacillus agaradhaerens]CAD61244.1 putative cellulase [[Bacillus] agaradhaerens] [Salipaludibacillus agaradhaerens]
MGYTKAKCTLKKTVLFGLILCLSVSMFVPMTSAEDVTSSQLDIHSYVADMQPGWNLGNTFDAVGDDETAWGNPRVTRELIKTIADEGYKSIRIPVTWQNQMGGSPDYTINEDYINRVEQAIDWALEEDLYVMLNVHHDSWLWMYDMEHNYDEVMARYTAIWEQLSEKFKSHSHKLMFESVNEPRFTQEWGEIQENHHAYLEDLNKTFYYIVRESGGNNVERPLVLPTIETATSQDLLDRLYQTMEDLDDPYLIATVHYYGFWPFSVNIAGYTHFEQETQQDIIDTFDRVHNTFTARGVPVVLGEFGLLGFDKSTDVIQQGEKLKFFEFLIHHLNERDITHMLWDNGQHLNRETYAWYDQEFHDILKASWEGRSATAESNLIHVKDGKPIRDQDIQLYLNGNELTALQAGEESLVLGEDYELAGGVLTLKADTLTRLITPGQLGTNAVITAQFNSGADWRFQLQNVDVPTVENTDGSTWHFAIPTHFNGDSLATMEAVYANGEYAGPQDWTSFKEFGEAFSPNYATGEIIISEAFFNAVRDDDIHLTFHFWSGETVEYTLRKNGNYVQGRR